MIRPGRSGGATGAMDEVGTPFALTIDHQTMEDDTVTLRDRDSTVQQRIAIADLVAGIEERIGWSR